MSQLPEVEHFAAWMKGMRAAVEAGCAHAPSLESASQASAHAIFDGFTESAVLVRLFVTLPASDLPAGVRAEAEKLAACAPTTPVLTLLGTYGLEVEWRDRRQSRGHAAIPLVSSAFVSAIPMMARVLEELGADLKGFDVADRQRYVEPGLFKSGCFHVPDAAHAVDVKGRKVISAQDFVQRHGVRTVFGAGASYLGTSLTTTLICFTRDDLKAEVGQAALTALSQFRALTQKLVNDKQIFSGW
ncbi:MAG TPA: hypothetical protein VFA20_33765 [Myxococcaceae bacterium]|nr:hypothetical protein [Myxococcaceae bacterium]